MKTALLFVCLGTLVSTIQAATFCSTTPGTWCEEPVGDAGAYTNTAQTTFGAGTLNNIYGIIGNGTAGSDFYYINIPDPTLFSASFSAYTGINVPGEAQAALYLFSANGAGIEAADDSTSLTSFTGPAGFYLVGIAPDGNITEYKNNGSAFSIFSPFVSGQVSYPVAGASTLAAYSNGGCGSNCAGGYDISLTGAQYANAPEPASLALAGAAIALFGLATRSHRRKSVVF